MDALIDAAEAGKQVLALVEIKARFDEQANISWARKLEQAGVHVVYGIVGLKTHAKLSLVVRQEPDGLRRYCHVGTGNYNPKTARLYEDLGLLDLRPEVGEDLTRLFNQLSGYAPKTAFRRLLVAPRSLRSGLVDRDRARGGAPPRGPPAAWVRIKVNSVVDEAVIDALYRASTAGVPVDVVVRGICALRPGVPGLSENDPGAQHPRALPRALPGVRVRRRRRPAGLHRQRRHDAPQPRPAGRGARPARRPVARRPSSYELLSLSMSDETASWHLRPDGTWTRHTTGPRTASRCATCRSTRWRDDHDVDRPRVADGARDAMSDTAPRPRSGDPGTGARADVRSRPVSGNRGTAPDVVRAAGAVCWREGPGGLQVLLVHRPRYLDWSWPKGKLDAEEVPAVAAVREVEEETGLRVRLGTPLPTARYRLRPGADKVVSYWAAHVTTELPDPPRPDEVDRTRWVAPEVAASMLTRRGDRAQLDAVREAWDEGRLTTWPLLVVRHAQARARADWQGDDADRPLAPAGVREAAALQRLLQTWQPRTVVTSPWRRCVDSVTPYTDAVGARLCRDDGLSETGHRRDAAGVAGLVGRLVRAGDPAAVCTHRPVLGTMLGSLAGHCSAGVGEDVPVADPFLAAAEVLVAHVGRRDRVVAVERRRPLPG